MSNMVHCAGIGPKFKLQCHVVLHFNWHTYFTDTVDNIPILFTLETRQAWSWRLWRWMKCFMKCFEAKLVCELIRWINRFKCLLICSAEYRSVLGLQMSPETESQQITDLALSNVSSYKAQTCITAFSYLKITWNIADWHITEHYFRRQSEKSQLD